MSITVCGFETLEAIGQEFDYVYNYSNTLNASLGLEWTFLNTLYTFTAGEKSSTFCNDETLEFFEDAAYT